MEFTHEISKFLYLLDLILSLSDCHNDALEQFRLTGLLLDVMYAIRFNSKKSSTSSNGVFGHSTFNRANISAPITDGNISIDSHTFFKTDGTRKL